LGQVSKERGDLSKQLSSLARKKETLNEELMRVRQRLEQASETNARLNRDTEDLMKDKEGKQVKRLLLFMCLFWVPQKKLTSITGLSEGPNRAALEMREYGRRDPSR
jgi:regulator of replication initiation timing